MNTFDVIIIGAGIAGLSTAKICAKNGLKVAIIEREKNIGGRSIHGGGTFIHHLFQSIKMVEIMKNSDLWNLKMDPSLLEIDFATLFSSYAKRKLRLQQKFDEDIKVNNITHFVGNAHLEDAYTVHVSGEELTGKYIVIAHGSKPRIPVIKNIEQAMKDGFVVTANYLENLTKRPKSVCVLGGGRVAYEVSELFSRINVPVTMLSRDKVLTEADEDAKAVLLDQLDYDVLTIVEEYDEVSIEGKEVVYIKDGKKEVITPEMVILAAGFMLDNYVLGTVVLEQNDNGIITDQYCRTSVEHIFAIGDANHRQKLSSVAIKEGEIAASCIAGKPIEILYHQYMNGLMGVYEYAYFGKDELEIQATGEPYYVTAFDMRNEERIFSHYDTPLIKIIFSKITHKVLGIHVVGENANDELAQLYSMLNPNYFDQNVGLPIHSHLQEIKDKVDDLDRKMTHHLVDDAMSFVYQKIVHNKTFHLAGYESFSRFMIDHRIWRPLPIIEMLEGSGLISLLDLKSLAKAASLCMTMQNEMNGEKARISVNISSVTLMNIPIKDFLDAVSHYHCPFDQIMIEVTERQVINQSVVLATLKELQKAGFLISLDDFSMGHASLPLLYEFSFNEVKLDRELLPKNAQDVSRMTSYKYLVSILKQHGVTIVAEGVENTFHVAFLKELEVDLLQGYYFSQPEALSL